MPKMMRGARKRCATLLQAFSLDRPMQIGDVGARMLAKPPYHMLMEQGGAHLVGFEPDDGAFEKLAEIDAPNTTYVQAAIGRSGPATFYRHPIGSLSSLFPIHAPSARFLGKFRWTDRDVKHIPVDVMALDDVEEIDRLDVLKMDLQGGELDVLEGGAQTLSQAVAVIPEVRFHQMYEGEPLWADLDRKLREMGFVLHKFLFAKSVTLPSQFKNRFTKRAIASQLLDGDAVYIRRLDDIENVSSEQLKYLTLAADSIFLSYDLVLMCLDELARRGEVGDRLPLRYFRMLPRKLKKETKAAEATEQAHATIP